MSSDWNWPPPPKKPKRQPGTPVSPAVLATRLRGAFSGGAPRLSRRGVLIGAGTTVGALAVAAAGVATGRMMEETESPEEPRDLAARSARASAAPSASVEASATPAVGPMSEVAPSPEASPASAEAIGSPPPGSPAAATPEGRAAAAVALDGAALVSSPRVALFGIGAGQMEPLLAGMIDDWREVGAAMSMPVEPMAIEGSELAGTSPASTLPDYDAFVSRLADHPGAVTVAPLEAIDFRVNVLSLDGHDPLRSTGTAADPLVRIAVVGDIVPGRNVHYKMVEYNDFQRPFREIAAHLAAYDLTIANLEGNLSASLPQPADANTYSFVSDPAMIDGFKLAGIDAVTLANNHSVFNEEGWGTQGLTDTMDALDAANFPFFGSGRNIAEARLPWTTEVNGMRVALIGVDAVTSNYEVEPGAERGVVNFDAGASDASPGNNPWVTSQFLDDIASAKEGADIVIPYFHGGVEYVAVPPKWLVDGARAAIEAGATLVVTNHPHVIQGMEVYQGRPIVYSPGNFIFDQMFSVEVRSGLVLDLTLRGDRVVGLRCHGVEIMDFHQPRLMTSGERAGLMDRFWRSTDRLAGGEYG